MRRLPRDLSGRELATLLASLGYQATRHTGSHLRVTTLEHGEHHVTIPMHDALRVGTLSGSDQLLRFPLSGGTPTTLAADITADPYNSTITTNEDYVLWVSRHDDASGCIMRVHK